MARCKSFPTVRNIPSAFTKGCDNLDNLILAVQIPLADKKRKKKRVDLTIPDDLLRQVDKYVEQTEGINRSSFFAFAALQSIQRVTLPKLAKATRLKGGKTTRLKSRKKN